MAGTWEVSDTTATYKNDANKVVATIKGLKSGLSNAIVAESFTVTEGESGAAGTIKVSPSVLGELKVTLTVSKGSKYVLDLYASVDRVKIEDPKLTYASGKATVKGNLTAGYTLASDAKSITYSAAKTDATLATVSGLVNTLKTAADGTIYASTESGGDADETEEVTAAISFNSETGTITLTEDALAKKDATLKLDYANSGYKLAFSEVSAPVVGTDGTWSYSNNVASYKAKVTGAGYTLSLDGKTATYTAANDSEKVLVKVSGVKSKDGLEISAVEGNANYSTQIKLSGDALTTKNVSISSGKGYLLALDEGVLQEETTTDTWSISKNVATYKQIQPVYYTYDVATNKVTYTKPVDIKTYATVSNVNSNLVADGNKLVTKGEDSTDAITVDGTTINILSGALNKKKVTLNDVSEGGYKLKLDTESVTAPSTSDEKWSIKGTVATLSGKITEAGYAQPDDKTITYAGKSTKAVTLATVSGVAKNLKLNEGETAVGTNVTDGETTEFVSGLVNDEGILTLSANVLGNTNVTLTSGAGFNYKLALDNDSESAGGIVPTSASNTTFWDTSGENLLLKDGKTAYYTKTNDTTISYTAPKPENTIATIVGLKSGLTVDDNGEIDGITIDSSTKQITLSGEALDAKNVSISGSGNYTLALASGLAPKKTTGWDIDSDIAYLKAYTSEGYKLNGSKAITYSARVADTTKGNLATLTGLKKGLAVKSDGSINGIAIGNLVDGEGGEAYVSAATEGESETEKVFTEDATGNIIQLSKSVLGTTDVTLKGDGYGLAIADGVTVSKVTPTWTIDNKGKVTYKLTTTAGHVLTDTEGDLSKTLAYNKKGTDTVTITGLKKDALTKDETTGEIGGITANGKVITLTDTPLEGATKVTISGGSYTLALDDVDKPTVSPIEWKINDKKKTATLYGTVTEAGFELSADGKTVTYLAVPESEGEEDTSVVLTTITGLKSGLTAGKGVNGIAGVTADDAETPTKFTLSASVLGTSKVSISGGEYKLALATDVATEAKEATEWVTSGNTANYKKYTRGYFTPNETGSVINYTAATKGSTYATVKGIASGVDVNDNFNSSTNILKLTSDQLTTKDVTITGTGYKLDLDGGVPQTSDTKTEWVTDKTTATLKSYVTAYYTRNNTDTKITYKAATKGATISTVKGIKSGVDVNSGYNSATKILTLNADQLDGKKVTISGDEYKLALDKDVTEATELGKVWGTKAVKSGKTIKSITATYEQAYTSGYAKADDSKSITYSDDITYKTLATIKGLNPEIEVVAPTWDEETSTLAGAEITGIEVDDTKKEITFSSTDLVPSKATLTSDTYSLAVDSDALASEEPKDNPWTIDKKNGKATYKVSQGAGLDLSSDAKTVTAVAAADKTLLTISNLNATALKTLSFEDEDNPNDTAQIPGINVDTEAKTVTLTSDAEQFITKKATLGKNDDYTFVFDGLTEPEPYKDPKWSVKTVKSTVTATLKDGVEAGYVLSEDAKTVSIKAEEVGDTVLTITGLKKGVTVTSDHKSIGLKDSNKNVVNGITMTASKVTLDKSLLGTADVTLDGKGYTFNPVVGVEPGDVHTSWEFKSGTATYKSKQDAGFTLSSDNKTFAYTPASTTTLATVKGLNKAYDGDLNYDTSAISVSGTAITIGKKLVTTSKITVTVPKKSTAYTLKLASGVKEAPETVSSAWVTSKTTASLKDYTTPYYTPASDGKSITYNKEKDVKVYATVKGIKSGATVSDTDKVITLSKAQLGNSNVSLTAGAKDGYSLAFGTDVPKTADDPEETTEWFTKGTTATYQTYTPGYFEANSKNTVFTYKKMTPASEYPTTGHATIKGANGDISAERVDDTTFNVSGDELNNKVTLMGGGSYAFNITSYTDSTITGSDKADTITANGAALSISGGKDADVITTSGNFVTVLGGAGNDVITNGIQTGEEEVYTSGINVVLNGGDGDDTITSYGDENSILGGAGADNIFVKGTGTSVNAGAGDDTIDDESEGGGNVFIFAKDQGADTINGFKATDAIQTTSGTAKAKFDSDDIVITFGKGTITLSDAASLGAITINGIEVVPDSESEGSANVLLADDNYSTDAAQLSSIVEPFKATYTPYDFDTTLSLTKEENFTPEITYSKDNK